MRFKLLCVLIAAAVMGVPSLARAEATPFDLAIIAKARAYVGPEATLNSIRTIHFTGHLTTDDGAKAALDIMFKKPCCQRVVTTGDKQIEVTALDDYDAWQRISDAKDLRHKTLAILGKDKILRLRANTFENLYFFRGVTDPEDIDDLGRTTIDGREAVKLRFNYDPGIYFVRYFDVETGKLLRTETAFGDVIVEEGRIVVDGVKFAKRIITTSPKPGGGTYRMTVDFDKVTLNEEMPESLFSVPLPTFD
ncbi:hypothetical protein GALL_142000 [mine drainage metagenome]|uniref:Outer membrane lipoprotein-sorting protein n=1 Tax=mine drainage metagenome TaxID=410659 RepID=A0A1J5SQ66_9ZZZZ